MAKLTMNVKELAETLGVSVLTIYDRRSRHPDALPKALDIPGQSTLLWLYSDVEKWLIRFTAEAKFVPEPKRRKRVKLSSRVQH